MNNHLVRLGHEEDYDRIFEMLTRRKQFQAGEIPLEQPKMVKDAGPAFPEGRHPDTLSEILLAEDGHLPVTTPLQINIKRN